MVQEKDFIRPELEGLEILITEEQIQQKVIEIGQAISHDYRENEGRDLVLIAMLNGASFFQTDLLKNIYFDPARLKSDFMRVESYKNSQIPQEPRIVEDTKSPIGGKDIIIVEDIVDSGGTMEATLEMLRTRNPNSLEICSLLSKTEKRKEESKDMFVKYLGFEIPDEYVVGYGLDDSKERYRTLRYIGYFPK